MYLGCENKHALYMWVYCNGSFIHDLNNFQTPVRFRIHSYKTLINYEYYHNIYFSNIFLVTTYNYRYTQPKEKFAL